MNPSFLVRMVAPGFLMLALVVTVTQRASAQGTELSTSAARDLYQKASSAEDRNDWTEARRLFLELWKQSRTYDVASGLGQSEFKLGRHAVGARYMALALANMPIKEKLESRQRIESALQEMKAEVGTVHVHVNQDGAEVRTDGESQGTAPLPGDIFLEPGAHAIEAQLGQARISKSLDVVAGNAYNVDLKLSSPFDLGTSAMPAMKSGLEEPKYDTKHSIEARTVAIWTGVGVTAVSLGIGIGFALKSSSANDDAKGSRSKLSPGDCFGSAVSSPSCNALGNSLDQRNSANNGETISLAVSGVAAAATTAMFFIWPTHESKSASRVRLVPIAARNTGGLTINGNF